MLRVRTVISGWTGGPGLATAYFLTPLQDSPAALRCVEYVRTVLIANRGSMSPTAVTFQVSGAVDVLAPSTGMITDTLSVDGGPVQGSGGGSGSAPPAVAALLQLRSSTFIAGRRVIGRNFISPLAAAAVTSDGNLGNVQQAALAGRFAAMATALEPGDQWVIWHRPSIKGPGQAVVITATAAPFKLAVLTSRRD